VTTTVLLVLAATSLVAATANGALGYGYSSISVPIALLVVTARVLSPALVVIEVAINLYALYWTRGAVRAVLPRVLPLLAGLVPGVITGALLIGHVAPAAVKLVVYCVLLPLIVLQASGVRWPIRRDDVATFRRVCMSFDAYLVAFGLSRALADAGVEPLVAYQALALTSIIDTILLWGFFREPAASASTVVAVAVAAAHAEPVHLELAA